MKNVCDYGFYQQGDNIVFDAKIELNKKVEQERIKSKEKIERLNKELNAVVKAASELQQDIKNKNEVLEKEREKSRFIEADIISEYVLRELKNCENIYLTNYNYPMGSYYAPDDYKITNIASATFIADFECGEYEINIKKRNK